MLVLLNWLNPFSIICATCSMKCIHAYIRVSIFLFLSLQGSGMQSLIITYLLRNKIGLNRNSWGFSDVEHIYMSQFYDYNCVLGLWVQLEQKIVPHHTRCNFLPKKVPSKNFSLKTIMGLAVKHYLTYMKFYKHTVYKVGLTLEYRMFYPLRI